MFALTIKNMKIAFDAKRAYQNGTGLGFYSRTLISSLATYFPEHQYFMCAPKVTGKFDTSSHANISNITPQSLVSQKIRSLWRSKWIVDDLLERNVDIYHGLSHEIPLRIRKTPIKTVVTIHDLIFERYPEMYNWIDVQIYRSKFKYACAYADKIIAISEQTKADIIKYYDVPEGKVDICYQSCNPAFGQTVSDAEKQRIKDLYRLPDAFLLYVGSIIERKNLLNICKALHLLKTETTFPLVVIGEGGEYKNEVKQYISEVGLGAKIIFLSEVPLAKSSPAFQSAADFPAIYQLAKALIYPSVFEGFGLPVLEALLSNIPVITSNVSCLPETGGNAAYYVNPYSPAEIAEAITQVVSNTQLVANMVAKGQQHAQKFTLQKCAASVMEVYLRLHE